MSKKVLIIEDDIDISEVLKLQLQLKEYHPTVASSYLDATPYFKDPEIKLFLIDRMLPDSSGIDICKMLRKSEFHQVHNIFGCFEFGFILPSPNR